MLGYTLGGLSLLGLSLAADAKAQTGGWETRYTATGTRDVAQAAATAKTSSPVSSVKGKAFDRIAIIYFENQNYDKAFGDANFEYFANKGITLSNYYAATHPSQPNYMAGIAGDYFGMDSDDFLRAPIQVATVIDLLDSKNISWAHYQEDLPYSGFEGTSFRSARSNGANDYVRKHNPAIMHDSITHYEQRLSQIKNLSLTDTTRSSFHHDLDANTLPQWMFITPNMTSDGHDSSITTAGVWARRFLDPLLGDQSFMQRTLVLLTWDESESYTVKNNILGILLGDAVPSRLVGSTDDSFYTHYSEIATVSANWDLPTLGRWDVGANVYSWVAEQTGDRIRAFNSSDEFNKYYWNSPYNGYFNSDGNNTVLASPNLALDTSFSGRPILQSIKDAWSGSGQPTYYVDRMYPADGANPPKGFEA